MKPVKEKRKIHFCKPMKRHFMTRASSNAAAALSMAKELHSMVGPCDGVAELVNTINPVFHGCKHSGATKNQRLSAASQCTKRLFSRSLSKKLPRSSAVIFSARRA